jgi:flagellar biosynthetic protein FliR
VSIPSIAATQLIGFILVLCRVGGLFVLAPIFSGRMIPTHAKLIIAGGISFAIMPLVTTGAKIPTGIEVVPLIMKELIVGLAIALGIGILGSGIQAAASLLDTMVGFSFAALVDPLSNVQSAVIGQFYSMFTVLVFLMIGGDRLMIEGIAASYRLVPVGQIPSTGQFAAMATDDLSKVFVIGLEIAAPVLIALALVDVALALVARSVPNMNVFFVGVPAKILVGLGAIAASLPFLTMHLHDELQQAVYQALQAVRIH